MLTQRFATAANGNSSWSNLFSYPGSSADSLLEWKWTCGSGSDPSVVCGNTGAETYLWQHDVNSNAADPIIVTVAQVNSTAAGGTSTYPSPSSSSSAPSPSSSGSGGVKEDNCVCPQQHTVAVGIGVGVGLGVPLSLALVLVGCLCVGERRRNKVLKAAKAHADYNPNAQLGPLFVPGTKAELSTDGIRSELPGR